MKTEGEKEDLMIILEHYFKKKPEKKSESKMTKRDLKRDLENEKRINDNNDSGHCNFDSLDTTMSKSLATMYKLMYLCILM